MRLDGIDKITMAQYEDLETIYNNRESIYYGRDVLYIKSITISYNELGVSCILELVSDNIEMVKDVAIVKGHAAEIKKLNAVLYCLDKQKTVMSQNAASYIKKAIELLKECY
jgi:hypothetical protein